MGGGVRATGYIRDSNNRLTLFIENGSAAARTATVEYLQGAYTTTVTPNGL